MFSTMKYPIIVTAAMALLQTDCNREDEPPPTPTITPDRTTDVPSTPGQTGDMPARNLDRDDIDSLSDAFAAVARSQVKLQAAEDAEVSGTVYFLPEGDDVVITAMIEGLPPGLHGIHIHENGDCSAADFSTAGGHFNPTNAKHGAPFANTKHLGDLGNLATNEGGTAIFAMRVPTATLDPGATDEDRHSIAGKAMIVHQGADDLRTDPDGGAGARIACGVIPAQTAQ